MHHFFFCWSKTIKTEGKHCQQNGSNISSLVWMCRAGWAGVTVPGLIPSRSGEWSQRQCTVIAFLAYNTAMRVLVQEGIKLIGLLKFGWHAFGEIQCSLFRREPDRSVCNNWNDKNIVIKTGNNAAPESIKTGASTLQKTVGLNFGFLLFKMRAGLGLK